MEIGNFFYHNTNYELRIPVEKTLEVIEYLNSPALASLQLVSKSFYNMVQDSPTWKNVVSLTTAYQKIALLPPCTRSLGALVIGKKAVETGEAELALKMFDEGIKEVDYPQAFYSPTHTLYELLFSILHFYGRRGKADQLPALRERISYTQTHLINQFDYYAWLYGAVFEGTAIEEMHNLDHRGYSPMDLFELLDHFSYDEIDQKNQTMEKSLFDPYTEGKMNKKYLPLFLLTLSGRSDCLELSDTSYERFLVNRWSLFVELLLKNHLQEGLNLLKRNSSKDFYLYQTVEMMMIISNQWKLYHHHLTDHSHPGIQGVYQGLKNKMPKKMLANIIYPNRSECLFYIEHLAKKGQLELAKEAYTLNSINQKYPHPLTLSEETIGSVRLNYKNFLVVDSAFRGKGTQEYLEILKTRLYFERALFGKDTEFLEELLDFFPYYNSAANQEILNFVYVLLNRASISSSEVWWKSS